eukprot:g4364.t1
MGAGASTALADEALLGLINEDVERAERLVSEAKRARAGRPGTGAGASGRELKIHALDGSRFNLPVDDAATVEEVVQSISERLEPRPGRRLVLTSGDHVLEESKALWPQVENEEITYVAQQVGAGQAAVTLHRALSRSSDQTRAEVNAIDAIDSLVFGEMFNQSLENVTLPGHLQILRFGSSFNQSLEDVLLPNSLQSLTFGSDFNQSLAGVRMPTSLETLTLGESFNQSLAGVTLPSSLQTLAFGDCFDQRLKSVSLPNSIKTLSFGSRFNQSLVGVTLPSSLETLSFADCFNKSMDDVTFPSSLQALTFGWNFNQSLRGVELPNRLQTLTQSEGLLQKFASIISPREDAQMFRCGEQRSVPCECIVELYELLWRWGHRKKSRFAENFGFSIPDTVVIAKGRPYAWYFISRKDGSLLRKSEGNLSLSALERKLVGDRDKEGRDAGQPCAIWLPMASQFPESRSPTPYAEFLSVKGLQEFIMLLRERHSGILQAFVQPFGVSNSLVRTVEFRRQTSLCLRTNRSLLSAGGNLFDRCATFEGWEGLSSSSSRYRNHRHPQMEDVILAASETLNRRIEQERVRQMLFLGPHQHVALHFKVAADGVLNFIFASIVSEKDVILQTRYHLIMADPCMTEEQQTMRAKRRFARVALGHASSKKREIE